MEILLRLFSGIGTFFTEDPLIALVRFAYCVRFRPRLSRL